MRSPRVAKRLTDPRARKPPRGPQTAHRGRFGIKEDPRIPEECREDLTAKIKSAGRAGIVS